MKWTSLLLLLCGCATKPQLPPLPPGMAAMPAAMRPPGPTKVKSFARALIPITNPRLVATNMTLMASNNGVRVFLVPAPTNMAPNPRSPVRSFSLISPQPWCFERAYSADLFVTKWVNFQTGKSYSVDVKTNLNAGGEWLSWMRFAYNEPGSSNVVTIWVEVRPGPLDINGWPKPFGAMRLSEVP